MYVHSGIVKNQVSREKHIISFLYQRLIKELSFLRLQIYKRNAKNDLIDNQIVTNFSILKLSEIPTYMFTFASVRKMFRI